MSVLSSVVTSVCRPGPSTPMVVATVTITTTRTMLVTRPIIDSRDWPVIMR